MSIVVKVIRKIVKKSQMFPFLSTRKTYLFATEGSRSFAIDPRGAKIPEECQHSTHLSVVSSNLQCEPSMC